MGCDSCHRGLARVMSLLLGGCNLGQCGLSPSRLLDWSHTCHLEECVENTSSSGVCRVFL